MIDGRSRPPKGDKGKIDGCTSERLIGAPRDDRWAHQPSKGENGNYQLGWSQGTRARHPSTSITKGIVTSDEPICGPHPR